MDKLKAFREELKAYIFPPDIKNPYYQYSKNQPETTQDTTYHFAKGILNDDLDTTKMLKEICQTGISASEFLSLCGRARHLSGADIASYKQEGKPNRLPAGGAIRSLNKILEHSKGLRESLSNEPSPLTLDVALMSKFDIRYKTKEREVPRLGSLDEILKTVVKLTEERKKILRNMELVLIQKQRELWQKNLIGMCINTF